MSFLAGHHCFTLAEFTASLLEAVPSTVRNRLLHAARAGQVVLVAPGVYVSRVGVFADRVPDPLVVASKLAPDAVLAYHSALAAHGVAHSHARRVTLLSRRRAHSLTFGDYEYVRLPFPAAMSPQEGERFVTTAGRDRQPVRVTTRERTIVDCLSRLVWSGGLEELLRSMGSIPSVDVPHLIDYLDRLSSPALVARTAWVLFSAPDLWGLGPVERTGFAQRLGRGPFYMGPRRLGMRFVAEWRLYVPADSEPEAWLRG